MEICDKCNTRFFMGECKCPTVLTLEKLKELVGGDTMRILYGNPLGRIESYYVDNECISGYDSSGGYVFTPLEELNMDFVMEINKITTVFKNEVVMQKG